MTASSSLPPAGLPALEARLRQDLAWLGLPEKCWTPTPPDTLDLAIIGSGMAGLALNAAATHLGLRVAAFDQAPAGFEGPWATSARMQTLRSPKTLTGPALGLPALTFRAWYEAQFGAAGWDALGYIPRLQWMDYLRWYRQVLRLDVRNQQRVLDVVPHEDGVDLHLADLGEDGRVHVQRARHVALATGRDGLGGPWVPDWAHRLPRDRWAHSADAYVAERLRGLRVVVIGGGASAMDSAATALEAGAARVDLLIRRSELPRINKGKGAGNPGVAHGFWQLPPEAKWQWRHFIGQQQVPPPHLSTLRVSRHANAHFHLGTAVQDATPREDGALRLETNHGPMAADYVIFCTGFQTDWDQRPEFRRLAPHVRRWRDVFAAPAEQSSTELADSPDLGPLLELQPRDAHAPAGLDRVHVFCHAASLSHGQVAGDIPLVSHGALRLAQGLAGRLLREDAAHHYAAMERYAEPELQGDEWTPADFPAYDETRATFPDTPPLPGGHAGRTAPDGGAP